MANEYYAKLDQNIVYSSMWEEDGDTVKVWITILALKNYRTGIVDKNVTGIARLCNLSVEKVEQAILKFESPDERSTTKDHEGRRLKKVEGGWLVLQHEKYIKFGWSDEKREYERIRKANYRQGKRATKESEEPEKQKKPEQPSKPKIEIPQILKDSGEFMVWWERWQEHLKEKKKKPTSLALEQQLKKLEDAGVAGAIAMIRTSIENNWQGLFEQKGQFFKPSTQPQSGQRLFNGKTIEELSVNERMLLCPADYDHPLNPKNPSNGF